MSLATDNLTASIVSLTGAVDAAVLALQTGVPETVVQLAADNVAAQADRLKVAVVPVPVP